MKKLSDVVDSDNSDASGRRRGELVQRVCALATQVGASKDPHNVLRRLVHLVEDHGVAEVLLALKVDQEDRDREIAAGEAFELHQAWRRLGYEPKR